MGNVGGGQVVGFELRLELRSGGVDEEAGVGGTGAAPDYIGWGIIIPSRDFGEDASGFSGGGEVCRDEVETLGFVDSARLENVGHQRSHHR